MYPPTGLVSVYCLAYYLFMPQGVKRINMNEQDNQIIKYNHHHQIDCENITEHIHTQNHAHSHTHTHTKAVANRLARAIGHLESVKRMVQDERDCSEVLIQLAAVRAALNNTAKIILKDHIGHCLVDAVEANDLESLEALNKAIEQYL